MTSQHLVLVLILNIFDFIVVVAIAFKYKNLIILKAVKQFLQETILGEYIGKFNSDICSVT